MHKLSMHVMQTNMFGVRYLRYSPPPGGLTVSWPWLNPLLPPFVWTLNLLNDRCRFHTRRRRPACNRLRSPPCGWYILKHAELIRIPQLWTPLEIQKYCRVIYINSLSSGDWTHLWSGLFSICFSKLSKNSWSELRTSKLTFGPQGASKALQN